MVAAFPLAKIGILVLKQLSKPLVNIIKNEARRHPQVRKYVIIPTGRVYGWIENKTFGKDAVPKPKPLTEEEALEVGSYAIGEIILFALLSVLILAEYNRQGDKKAVIRRTKEEELNNLVETVIRLIDEVDSTKRDIKKIQSDLEIAFDVIELEEQRHSPIHDTNFLDIMDKGAFRSSGQVKPAKAQVASRDSYSPSV